MASDEQSKQAQGETAKSGGGDEQKASQTGTTDAVTLLKNDHREVEKLFAEYEKASNRSRKSAIIEQVAMMLKVHSELEESIFYPAVRQHAEADDKLDEAQVEHDTLKILIADLEGGGNSEFRDAKVKVLSEYVKHHVQEEEATGGILEQGRKSGLDLKELGQQMAQLKEELEADPSQLRAVPVSIQGFGQGPRSGRPMSGRRGASHDRQDRDEHGRFTERSGRGGATRSGDGEGQGWHGDPQGHSEAARRGWEDRR
ncbi:MAG: hemerythrin domain-containing protein [Novosphingobium sp.]